MFKQKFFIILFFSCVFFCLRTPQVYAVSEKYPLNIGKPVYSFKISGKADLKTDNSFVRVILIDSKNTERLVFETYPLISTSKTVTVKDTCEETCFLDQVTPVSLRIEKKNADFKITGTSYSSNRQEILKNIKTFSFAQEEKRVMGQKVSEKVAQIKRKNLKWVAGETSVSNLSYEEKKQLFRRPDGTIPEELPDLQGFEYYKSGIFEFKSDKAIPSNAQSMTAGTVPASWDWRNVHGENWNTPVRDQGAAGTCFAFAAVGAMESQINLYYNQHLNVDLSEQMYADCISGDELPLSMFVFKYPPCTGSNGMNMCYPGYTYCVFGIHGIADEACDPYAARNSSPLNCNANYICSNWQNRSWKLGDFHDYNFFLNRGGPQCLHQTMDLPEDEFKKVLIQKGPMSSGIESWGHAMVLVGYNGKSDWKTINRCQYSEMCTQGSGCIPLSCSSQGAEKKVCVNTYYQSTRISTLNTYQCKPLSYLPEVLEWQFNGSTNCPSGFGCVNDACVPMTTTQPTVGQKECTLLDYNALYKEYSEYRPNEGDNYWIFKNSWGPNWGENGYARVHASLADLAWGSLPINPIPPSGTTYQIACTDRDNDSYCNWGISETKPSTCPANCKAQKDCDDSNSSLTHFDENFNCIGQTHCSPRGNVNCQSGVDAFDLSDLLTHYASSDFDYDLDNSGKVNSLDVSILLSNFGRIN